MSDPLGISPGGDGGGGAVEIGLRLVSFRTLRFVLDPGAAVTAERRAIHFRLTPNVEFHPEQEHAVVRYCVFCFYGPGKEPPMLGMIETEMVVEIQGLRRLAAEGQYILPSGSITAMLLLNAYAATRGAFATRGAGTVLESAPLPWVTPEQLVEELKRWGHRPTGGPNR